MEWVIGVVVVLVVVGILFGKKLKFVPGCGTGVPSPDRRFCAYLKTQRDKQQAQVSQVAYELSVVLVLRTDERTEAHLDIFKTIVPDYMALPDLKDKKTDEIIRWQADSGTVTFHAGRQPIVVNVAECAADPKVQEKKALILQELGKK